MIICIRQYNLQAIKSKANIKYYMYIKSVSHLTQGKMDEKK